jgi:HSP20 family molecular chaperone IbpA
MSRSTASPPSELGVLSKGRPTRERSDDHERQAMRPRCQPVLLGARTAHKKGVVNVCARRPPPDQSAVKPLVVHCDADAVRSVLEFDRLAEQIAAGARTPRPFPMDPYRRGDEFVVSFDPPGMAPGTIDLTVEQNVLTINAERRFDGQEGDEVIAAERLQALLPASCSWRDARRRAPRGQLRNRGADVANPGRRFGEAPQGADHRRRRRPDDRGSDHAGRRVEPLSQNAPASAAAV